MVSELTPGDGRVAALFRSRLKSGRSHTAQRDGLKIQVVRKKIRRAETSFGDAAAGMVLSLRQHVIELVSQQPAHRAAINVGLLCGSLT